MTYAVDAPFRAFVDAIGEPLEAGKIYVGEAGLDAQANPISAFWDSAGTIAATQPIRTIAGLPSNTGTPSQFYVAQAYSITITDKEDVVLYSTLNAVLGMGIGIVGGDAAISESNAAAWAAAAQTSANNAAASEAGVAADASSASDSETAAALSEANAATSETNAATSETNAATFETNAATSATTAANEVASIGTSVADAANSASAAATSETNAATSEGNAATSETNAAASAALAAGVDFTTLNANIAAVDTKADDNASNISGNTTAITERLEITDNLSALDDKEASRQNLGVVAGLPDIVLQHTTAAGVSGGATAVGTQVRPLNAVAAGASKVNLTANQFKILEEGVWKIDGFSTIYRTSAAQYYLYNVDTDTIEINFATVSATNTYLVGAQNILQGSFEVTNITHRYELRYWVGLSDANGWGATSSSGLPNVWANIELRKL